MTIANLFLLNESAIIIRESIIKIVMSSRLITIATLISLTKPRGELILPFPLHLKRC